MVTVSPHGGFRPDAQPPFSRRLPTGEGVPDQPVVACGPNNPVLAGLSEVLRYRLAFLLGHFQEVVLVGEDVLAVAGGHG